MTENSNSFVAKLLARFTPPSTKLSALVSQAHRGEISVEELLSAPCASKRLAPLAAVIADLLLDLKQQRAERAALEQEVRDRIANRTDALERKIGSLQVQATRDALTGLGNRRGLDADLQRIISTPRIPVIETCLLMIDVDHFKQLNDTLGHPAGDQLLKEIGQLIRSTLRANDLAYRCGGDEFVILLNGCNLVAAMSIATRLEAMVKSLTANLPLPLPPQLSIGAAAMSEMPEPTPQAWMQMADNRLYAVKSARPRSRRSA